MRALTITPVKGTGLHQPAVVELGPQGVVTNRRFYLIDDRGLMYNGKRHGPLVGIHAEYDPDDERLVLTFPDGSRVEGTAIGSGESVETSFYGRPVEGHVVEGPWAQALSRYTGTPLRLVASDRLGDAVDVHPVTLISTESIAELARRSGGDGDHRRFRMLIELAGGGAYDEDGWIGETVEVGSAVVRVEGPVPRCVVTTHSPDTGVRDFDTLRAIVAYRGARIGDDLSTPVDHLPDDGKACFGVYATVVRPGRVAVGDAVIAPS